MCNQKMTFSELYSQAKAGFRETMLSMWCSDLVGESQKSYGEQIKNKVDDFFAPSDAMPMVQCMDPYVPVPEDKRQAAIELVDPLWTKLYPPYQHQYDSWKALLQDNKSICVTTGTGSGKTECFMLPLVKDINRRYNENHSHQVRAIFLYPLNALMEDQKDRLEKALSNTDLKFAVYNGNLPDRDLGDDPELTERLAEERRKYPHIATTRDEMRYGVDILLTNPSMLEIMLLRNKDRLFIANSNGALHWIVIDETHTYTGAGATELSMLLRRVRLAFGIQNADELQFATSSATIGNGQDPDRDELRLKEFIRDISGQSLDMIKVIKGNHITNISNVKNETVAEYSRTLNNRDYLPLDDLITEGNTIEEKLQILDEATKDDEHGRGLKVKVHFFFRVINNGLKVRLDRMAPDGKSFEIFSEEVENSEVPYLELMRCKNCGEFIAVGEQDQNESDKYHGSTIVDNDMFDFSDLETKHRLLFSLTNKDLEEEDDSGNILVKIDGNSYSPTLFQNDRWNILLNLSCNCPNCRKKTTSKTTDEIDTGGLQNQTNKTLQPFRISADFVNRMIAPKILPLLKVITAEEMHEYAVEEIDVPFKGQQFLTFVDSRQAAARATLRQNLEEEKKWVYSRIFHKLCDMKAHKMTHEQYIQRLSNLSPVDPQYQQKIVELNNTYSSSLTQHLSWQQVKDLLIDPSEHICQRFAYQFANRSQGSDELDDNNHEVSSETINRYVYSVMIDLLGRRPPKAASPETMGLFTTCYPSLNDLALPDFVQNNFNHKLQELNRPTIDVIQWRNLIKIFMDHSVRANNAVFFKPANEKIDLGMCQRFRSVKDIRRPIKKPVVTSNNPGIIVSLLCNCLSDDNVNTTAREYKDLLQGVIDAMWDNMVKCKLLEMSEGLDRNNNWYKDGTAQDDNGGRRLQNLNEEGYFNYYNLAFKLYDHVYMCDSSTDSMLQVYRPEPVTFMGYSPILSNRKVTRPIAEAEWIGYPFVYGKDGNNDISKETLVCWAKENRRELFDWHLWGDGDNIGAFSNYLVDAYMYPDIFIEAEHTAQVDKEIAKQSQDMFKHKLINILACSTTMEMGIDLGNLELVMMNSVPPQPANYKQRAGRSGRDLNINRSVSITLCGSDAIGLHTMRDPLGQLIGRHTAVPMVDLTAQNVIQRHVNSFLLRESGTFFTDDPNNLDMQIIDFFTPFHFEKTKGKNNKDITNYQIIKNRSGEDMTVLEKLGNSSGTRYNSFLEFLDDISKNKGVEDKIQLLLENTCFEKTWKDCAIQTRSSIIDVYDAILTRLEDYRVVYKELYDKEETNVRKSNPNYSDKEVRTEVLNKLKSMGKANFMHFKYSSELASNLLNYFATHRFTPNANMPVNIIEFDINGKNANFQYIQSGPSNPSYQLQEAISQYSPGNAIVLSNRVRIVRGFLYSGWSKPNVSFKRIYSDGNKAVVDTQLQNAKTWNVNGKQYLDLVEPFAFLPDDNETESRTIELNKYTVVNAQLIGASDWDNNNIGSHLFSYRSSAEDVNAQILYYNQGIGFGYCICTQCHRAVLETKVAGKDPTDVPTDFWNGKVNNNPLHNYLRKDNNGTKKRCLTMSNLANPAYQSTVRRNVIIGGFIQTDYTEIRILKHAGDTNWISADTEENKNLLITLAILFSNEFALYVEKERKDVDFLITPDGHICIFDTNPGGSGYSKKLASLQVMNLIVRNSLDRLNSAKSKDELLERSTLKYYRNLDIEAAKEWLNEEIQISESVPLAVKNYSQNARKSSFEDIESDFKSNHKDGILFVNTDYKHWVYRDEPGNWRDHMGTFRLGNCTVNVLDANDTSCPKPVLQTLRNINDWASKINKCANPLASHNLYPIAVIGGHLYVTDKKDAICVNSDWAKDSVYCIDGNIPLNTSRFEIYPIDTPNYKKFILGPTDPMNTYSDKIAELVEGKCLEIINKFVDYCHNHQVSSLKITYQDEHLKSVLGMIATIRFIDYFASKVGKPYKITFEMEEYFDGNPSYVISYNLNTNVLRDETLTRLMNQWIQEANKSVTYMINTRPRKSLPHWRELKIDAGSAILTFYPNGGIINEWKLPRNVQSQYSNNSAKVLDQIPICRQSSIMYDIDLKIDD